MSTLYQILGFRSFKRNLHETEHHPMATGVDGRALFGWLVAGRPATPLTKSLFMWTVFPDRTIFFSHNNQPEQYFDLFFSPAEQAIGSIAMYHWYSLFLPMQRANSSNDIDTTHRWFIPSASKALANSTVVFLEVLNLLQHLKSQIMKWIISCWWKPKN